MPVVVALVSLDEEWAAHSSGFVLLWGSFINGSFPSGVGRHLWLDHPRNRTGHSSVSWGEGTDPTTVSMYVLSYPHMCLHLQPTGTSKTILSVKQVNVRTILTSLFPRYITNISSVPPFSLKSGLWRNKDRDVYPFKSSRLFGSRTSTPDLPLNLMGIATCEEEQDGRMRCRQL